MFILLHLTTILWSVWYCSVFTAGEAKAQHGRMTFPKVTCWQVKHLLIDISALEDWENYPHLHASVRVGLCQGYLSRSQCLFYWSSQPPFLRKLKSRRWMMAPEHRDKKYSPFVNCFDLRFPGLAEEAARGRFPSYIWLRYLRARVSLWRRHESWDSNGR